MRDLRIKRPCPFCDETEHLSFQESSCPWPIFEGGDTLKDKNGHDLEDHVDGVYCEVCGALVPLKSWNREIPTEELVMLRDFDPPAEITRIET